MKNLEIYQKGIEGYDILSQRKTEILIELIKSDAVDTGIVRTYCSQFTD